MQVKDLMTRKVIVAHPNYTLREAADLMKVLGVGSLPVCDGDALVGILTDRDITVRAVAEGQDPWKGLVRDVMTPEVIWCFEDEDSVAAAHLMAEKQLHRLAVLNHARQFVGMLSLSDLALDKENPNVSTAIVQVVSRRSHIANRCPRLEKDDSDPFLTSTAKGIACSES
jgi:CBS domain-containing protein